MGQKVQTEMQEKTEFDLLREEVKGTDQLTAMTMAANHLMKAEAILALCEADTGNVDTALLEAFDQLLGVMSTLQ